MVRTPHDTPGRQAAGRDPGLIRRRLVCRGAVQGVGFRPAVWRLANSMGLAGVVRNDAEGATIEVEGPAPTVLTFERRLAAELPPLARLTGLDALDMPVREARRFEVGDSGAGERRGALIPPDAALCPACRAELEDPRDRRHRYPFTTCTDCGPRFTLARALPYDRERTSMARFAPCPACAAEYGDPNSRRFHAEPICCPDCGPRLWLADRGGAQLAEAGEALVAARAVLARGAVLALLGLGGFQLACRADDVRAVRRLRRRKRRPTKPFALMAADLAAAHALVRLPRADGRLLESARAPILLAARRSTAPVADDVAPGLEDLGVMLPTTPLHVELFRDQPWRVLVMTSGNCADEPICRTPEEALERLAGLADAFLLHEREVVRRCDDSLVRSAPDGHVLVRRSRGWTPEPLALGIATPEPLLALGGHLQATACVAVGAQAFPSQHVGDLDSQGARAFLLEVAQGLEDFLQVRAGTLVVDEHPDYASTLLGERLAGERHGRLLRVQHHLAHAAAVLAEHDAFPRGGEQAAALVMDGTGLGPDGTAWGCELLLLDGQLGWRRLAGAEPLPLVGGERAVREPWRVACAALELGGCAELLERLPLARRIAPRRLRQVAALARRGPWPLAGGAGRLFEAAGALLGLCVENDWEGEAAARLEACAERATRPAAAWPELPAREPAGALPSTDLLVALARRVDRGEDGEQIAAGFHATVAAQLARRTEALPAGVRRIALGGGCLVNRILRRDLCRELRQLGLEPLLPRATPPGDGGLSFGQAALAAACLALDRTPHYLGGP